MPFIALRRFRATSSAAGVDSTNVPMKLFATTGGMCAIVITTKACKSITFIAPHRSLAASGAAGDYFRGQYLCERFHHAE
jgi:hypothetical protein